MQILSQLCKSKLVGAFKGQGGREKRRTVKEEFNSVMFSSTDTGSHYLLCFMPVFFFKTFCIIIVNSVGHSMLWHLCCFRSQHGTFFFCLLLGRKSSPFLQNLYFISNKKMTFLL